MGAAAWGAIGAVVGGTLTLIGSIVATRSQQHQTKMADELRRSDDLRRERKSAYLQFLSTVRRLRFVARRNGSDDGSDELQLRSALSSLTYEIEIIAPT